MANDIQQNLFEAIQNIAQATVSELGFDQTIICKIVDDSKKSEGYYTVTDDSVTFEAYSDSTDYSKGQYCYVLIPKGDWSGQKKITGRYNMTSTSINYVSNLEKMIVIAEKLNLKKDNASGEPLHWTTQELETKYNTQLCNSICVKLKIQTSPKSGANLDKTDKYGFLIKVQSGDTSTNLPVFWSSSMLGDPFHYYSPTEVEIFYQIPESIKNISEIEIQAVENGNNNIDNKINFQVSNVNIYLGFDTSNYKDKTVIVAPVEHEDTYKGASEGYPSNFTPGVSVLPPIKTRVRMIWINKNSDNKSIEFEDGKQDAQDEIPIYLPNIDKATDSSKLDTTVKDDGSGGVDIGKNYYWVDWLADTNYSNLEQDKKLRENVKQLVASKTKTQIDYLTKEYEIELLRQFPATEVQAVVWLNGKKYESALLTFKNQDIKSDTVAALGIKLQIQNLSGNTGVYRYNEENVMTDKESKRVCCTWTAYNAIEDTFWEGATITWKIPKVLNATLLRPVDNIPDLNYTSNNEYHIYKHTFVKADFEKDANGKEVLKETARDFSYNLANVYSSTALNNYIRCRIDLSNGKEYVETMKDVVFDSEALQGTDYIFSIAPVERKFDFIATNSSSDDSENAAKFQAKLLGPNGLEVPEYKVKWGIESFSNVSSLKIVTSTNTTPQNAYITMTNPKKYNIIIVSTEANWAGQSIKLIKKYPAVYSKNGKYIADTVMNISYDSFGTLLTPASNPLSLYEIKSDGTYDSSTQISCSWHINTVYSNGGENCDFAPRLVYKENKHFIIPSPFFVEGGDIKSYNVLYATNSHGEVLWSNPIIIQQNRFSNDLLNNWDGQLKIDTEGNYMLSRAMGAGVKHSDNSFSGVFMGQIKSYESTTTKETGLLGYNHGEQAFGFRDDGTAFIGKAGSGRINFNGTKGLIVSSAWENKVKSLPDNLTSLNSLVQESVGVNQHGILIDLKNGLLGLRANNGNYFRFDNDGLNINVNKLTITTGNTNGINLLKQTAPPQMTNSEITGNSTEATPAFRNAWSEGTGWRGVSVNANSDIVLTSSVDTNGNTLSSSLIQKIKFEAGKEYTISCTYRGNLFIRLVELNFNQHIGPEILNATNNPTNDQYFTKTFSFNEDTVCGLKIQNYYTANTSAIVHHLKLEEGSIATEWTENSEDAVARFNILNDRITSIITGNGIGTIIDQKTSAITSIAYGAGKYDFSKDKNSAYKIEVAGEGYPTDAGYDASDYAGKYYLNVSNGYVYKSANGSWTYESTLKTIYSKFDQTNNSISAKVSSTGGASKNGCGWKITENAFTVQSLDNSGKTAAEFICNNSGATIKCYKANGNEAATFSCGDYGIKTTGMLKIGKGAYVGGWQILDNKIAANHDKKWFILNSKVTKQGEYWIKIEDTDSDGATVKDTPFYIDYDGGVQCHSLNVRRASYAGTDQFKISYTTDGIVRLKLQDVVNGGTENLIPTWDKVKINNQDYWILRGFSEAVVVE